jgi:CheY-like chemotaxis protein
MAVVNKLLSGQRILVVEDEMLVLMETENMLADLGCDAVVAAATNEQAIALIEAQHFDVALLDLNLNGVRSYPVADLLAARGVPFAFATGYGGHGLRDGDRERPLLVKPFDCDGLEKLLTDLLSEVAPVVRTVWRPG